MMHTWAYQVDMIYNNSTKGACVIDLPYIEKLPFYDWELFGLTQGDNKRSLLTLGSTPSPIK